jgi:hypothetical protein
MLQRSRGERLLRRCGRAKAGERCNGGTRVSPKRSARTDVGRLCYERQRVVAVGGNCLSWKWLNPRPRQPGRAQTPESMLQRSRGERLLRRCGKGEAGERCNGGTRVSPKRSARTDVGRLCYERQRVVVWTGTFERPLAFLRVNCGLPQFSGRGKRGRHGKSWPNWRSAVPRGRKGEAGERCEGGTRASLLVVEIAEPATT